MLRLTDSLTETIINLVSQQFEIDLILARANFIFESFFFLGLLNFCHDFRKLLSLKFPIIPQWRDKEGIESIFAVLLIGDKEI